MSRLHPVRVCSARTCNEVCKQALTLDVNASSRSAPILCTRWYTSNCVLLYEGSASLGWFFPLVHAPLTFFFFLSISSRWERAATDRASSTSLQIVQEQIVLLNKNMLTMLRANVPGLLCCVRPNQLCENILDEFRFAFTDDAGQGGLLSSLLLCWVSREAIRVISVQLLDRLRDRPYGTRPQGYLCTLKRHVRNVDAVDDLHISPNTAGWHLFIAPVRKSPRFVFVYRERVCVEPDCHLLKWWLR